MRYLPLLCVLPLLAVATPETAAAGDNRPDAADVDAQLTALPHKALSDRVPVTIYRFRSGMPNLDPQSATDMFITELVRSGQFRVVERAEFQPDLSAEHGLNAAGQTTGDAAQHAFTGAKYIFEGAVSELGQQTDQQSGQVGVAGATLSGGGSQGSVTVDVRIVDAATGDILDSVSYAQKLDSKHKGIQGVGTLLYKVTKGKLGEFTPDISAGTAHEDSQSETLRAAMQGAILALVKDIG